ncbi:MAG: hydrogenase formation protein HypD [Deltaproteobacteria bacterium]|nr:hydrogenase formation protein HypD [Deltaproteobacteria bacterium]
MLARFRDAAAVRRLSEAIAQLHPGREIRLMHVCGTHENALCQFGLRDLLPDWVKLVAGPGCPVCVCPAGDLDMASRLALDHGVTVATFGDVVRVPARISLMEAKARGADVRVVYGIDDAVRLARQEPARQVAFFAVGFETTACTTAAALARELPDNFTVLVSHRLVPPALEALLASEGEALDGFVLPGHVTAVAGLADYQALAAKRSAPMAVAGFEPIDLLLAVEHLARRAKERRPGAPEQVFNAYSRLVKVEGNPAACHVVDEVFESCDAAWRGIGTIPASGQRIRERFGAHDAQRRFGLAPDPNIPDVHPGCRCGEVLLGRVEPEECPLFGKACHPDRPVGPCMVAFEGTCHARFRHRQ